MRRIIYVILAIMLIGLVTASGCGGGSPTTASPTTGAPATGAPAAGSSLELRFASFIPPTDVYAIELGNWAKDLEQRTNGRVKVNFFHGQSLLKVPEILDGVAAGTADMAFCFAGAFPDRLPLSQVMGLPTMLFGTSTQACQTWWALHSKYKEFEEEYTKAGVKVLWFQMPGPNQIEGNVKVQTLSDLNGVKIAVDVREELEAFKLLGAVPITVAGGDKYVSLQTNVVSSSTQNFNGSKTWRTFEVTKYITENVDISYRICPTIINLNTYNKMPDDIKKIFDELSDGAVMSKRAAEAYDLSNEICKKEVEDYHVAKGEPAIYRLPDSEKAAWRDKVQPVIDAWVSGVEAKGLPGKSILADLKTFAEQFK